MSKLLGEWPGVLAEDKIPHDSDLFKYCAERNLALWAFIRATIPEASGNLNKWVDLAIEKAERHREDSDALLVVVRATIPYRNAHTMAGANQEGESILDFQERLVGLRAELDKALAALPEHLTT
jgi:hypothetical protein